MLKKGIIAGERQTVKTKKYIISKNYCKWYCCCYILDLVFIMKRYVLLCIVLIKIYDVASIYPRVDTNGYVDFGGMNMQQDTNNKGTKVSNEIYQCTQKIKTNNVIKYSFPNMIGAEILGVSEKDDIPYMLTTSWNSEKGEMAIMCGLDKSSYLCTKFLPESKSSCKNKDDFCMYARLKDGKKVGFKIIIRGHQMLLPFNDYKKKFDTKTCPKAGYHKIAILEGRADYKICGPFFQHHFQVIQVDDGNEDDTIDSNVRCSIRNKNNNVWSLHERTKITNDQLDDITKMSESILARRRRRRRLLLDEMWMDC